MFKERLKELRESKQLTQSQLSEALDIGRASVSNYELGLRTPDIDILVRIANYFNVTTDYLTGRSNFKQSEQESYFSQDEKIFLSNINSYLGSKTIEEHIIREIDYFKSSILRLFDSNDYNIKIESSFVKTLHHIYTIYFMFNNRTTEFINNMNENILKDNGIDIEKIQTKKHILELLYTNLLELNTPSYNYSDSLSRIIEELFMLKNELEQSTGKICISTLLKYIESSSLEVNSALIDSIRKDYVGSLDD